MKSHFKNYTHITKSVRQFNACLIQEGQLIRVGKNSLKMKASYTTSDIAHALMTLNTLEDNLRLVKKALMERVGRYDRKCPKARLVQHYNMVHMYQMYRSTKF